MDKTLISSVMTRDVWTVQPAQPLAEVFDIMHRHRFSCVIVVEDGRPVGVISERDLVRVLRFARGRPDPVMTASAVMSAPAVTLRQHQTLAEALYTVRSHNIRRLPIVDDQGNLVGLVTQSDLLRAQCSLLEMHAETLKALVTERTTELGSARQREIVAQKAAFAGKLAAGLIHEFNNPMTAVIGELDLVGNRLTALSPNDPPTPGSWHSLVVDASRGIAAAQGALARITATVEQLQALCAIQGMEQAPEPTPIATIIRQAMAALGDELDDRTAVKHAELPAAVMVAGYRAEIRQALTQLIRFLLRRVPKDSPQRCVVIRVCEDRDSDVLVRIHAPQVSLSPGETEAPFDPSLVEDDARLRLSVDLSVVAASIWRSGGVVSIGDASASQGTTFEVRLPAA